ncbi:MAG: valine--tRNA ligase [Candidatus Margulisbacteria bacterium]|nr:valine--tRNA ligase [Candidatus Margulisiibacteriota bacterium]
MLPEMPKVYDPSQIEQKWYKLWEENRLFTPDENSAKPPFSMVIPPPNVTGNLHMGHALDNSIQDVLVRYKKMQGFNTLWIPGTDHAGIATQNVVVKALKAEGKTKEQLGREGFIKRVWQWKEEYGGNITRQLRRLGCALDWTRERFTMDEGLSKAVTHEFVTLYKEGLVYRGKRLVNWCPKCGTAISDIEVEHENKKGKLWHIKYPIESPHPLPLSLPVRRSPKDEGGWERGAGHAKAGEGYIVVATTRPETMLGDTAVAVNPDDERYKHLIGQMLVLPLVNRLIPIIKDEYVDAAFGTGAVKVTPAHDPNDFEMGERHGLPRVNILTKDAKITLEEFREEEKGEIAEVEGMDRFKARELLVEKLEQTGFIDKIEEYENAVGECYRCRSIIEPYLSDQWYVRVKDLAREAIKVVEEGKIKFFPDRWTKVYIDWMVNLKDWCISRQLWWGHRIPAWYRGEEIYVGEKAPAGEGWEQDPDVFDTWFSSALWPFSTLGWPEQTKDLETFYPTNVLVTGYDIITFWVSRMIMSGMHFMQQAPFQTVFIHGLVRDAHGKKMSKSSGNVVDPLEIIDKVGADALRFALISLITGQGQDIKLTPEKITEARNFCNKIWNASRFAAMTRGQDTSNKRQETNTLGLADRWIISRYQQTIKQVTRLLDKYDFGEAARALYDFMWGEFCDWYLEIAKIDLYSEDAARKKKASEVLFYVLEGTLKMLHPFMPFITEEIWNILKPSPANPKGTPLSHPPSSFGLRRTGRERENIILSDWPKADEDKIDVAAEKGMALLMEMVSKIRNIKAEMGVQTKEIEIVFEAPREKEREIIHQNQPLIKTLTKAVKVEIVERLKSKPKQAASGVVADIQFFVPLKGLIDIEKEVERLKKEENAIGQELARLTKLLADNNFTAKAAPEAVEKQRARMDEITEKRKILLARIKDLV